MDWAEDVMILGNIGNAQRGGGEEYIYGKQSLFFSL